jgi:hypothetical protein
MPQSPAACPSCAAPASGRFCANCGVPLEGAICETCGSALTAGAKFCHRCGTAVGAAPLPARRTDPAPAFSAALPWAVAGIALVALIALLAGQRFNARAATALDSPRAAAQPGGADDGAPSGPAIVRAPDISALSPRERADRLYDRIMRLDAQGKKDSVGFFAPMAISAYQMLPNPDLDSRYDMGRVAEVAGATPVASAQADTILRLDQSHLLGLILAMRVAADEGRTDRAKDLAARLIANADAELRKQLPEYERHQADIQDALADARKRWAKSPTAR